MNDLTFKQAVDIRILSRKTMRNLDDFMHMIRFQLQHLPELVIDKWYIDKQLPWDDNTLQAIHDEYYHTFEDHHKSRNYGMPMVFWKHAKKIKAEGSWWHGIVSDKWRRKHHGQNILKYEFKHLSCEVPVRFLKQSAVPLAVDFAFIDTMTPEYEERYLEAQLDDLHHPGNTGWFAVCSNDLHYCLPDMYWGVVFGRAYSKMFGMDKLLSAPAYHVEQLSDDAVYIQLSETLGDVISDFDRVQAVRERVKQHLGNAFYRPELKCCLNPVFIDTDHPLPAPGEIYDAPNFEFEKDRYTDWEEPPFWLEEQREQKESGN